MIYINNHMHTCIHVHVYMYMYTTLHVHMCMSCAIHNDDAHAYMYTCIYVPRYITHVHINKYPVHVDTCMFSSIFDICNMFIRFN